MTVRAKEIANHFVPSAKRLRTLCGKLPTKKTKAFGPGLSEYIKGFCFLF